MGYLYEVPEDKKVHVIIDTDAKNEADDQYAIVHGLLGAKMNVVGIVATQFGKRRTETSMEESYQECKKLVSLMDGMETKVYRGNYEELTSYKDCEVSEGARFIAEKAMEYKGNLYIACLGALTNVAAAVLYKPEIADKITVVWVGGRKNFFDNDGFEANTRNDYRAVNVVMEKYSNIIQIPEETYSKVQVSIAELQCKVRNCGAIGAYLFDQLNDFNYRVNRFWTQGESWTLGDTTAIAFLINRKCGILKKRKAFRVDEALKIEHMDEKEIQYLDDFDSRYALEDFFSKLYLKYGMPHVGFEAEYQNPL